MDADTMGTHGMLVVGTGAIYLSHLPMFMQPHDFQVILRVRLSKPGTDAEAVYLNDRRERDSNVYTLHPQRFAIDELQGAGGQPARTEFTGRLVRGHFERGGTTLLDDVTVHVEKVVHFRRFAAPPDPDELTYLVFGEGPEMLLAHLITRPPDFDQIVSVTFPRGPAGADRLPEGTPLVIGELASTRGGLRFRPHENLPDQRIREGAALVGEIKHDGEDGQGRPTIEVEVDREFYLEEGELEEDMRHHHHHA